MRHLLQFLCIGVGVALLSSCSTPTTKHVGVGPFVRRVDCSAVPTTKPLAEQARQIANEMYPQVCALLADGDEEFPSQFDICYKKHLWKDRTGEARVTQIRLSAAYADDLKSDPIAFRQIVIHEMAHVAQYYYRPILGSWLIATSEPPFCWQEGMADYVSFKLGQTNGWSCPQCNFRSASYLDGYSCAGAFLLYLDTTYNSNVVRQLNTAIRHGKYSDAFFVKATGKELPKLWQEFKQTSAFTPSASRMLALQEKLGFVNGRPPRDLEKRCKVLVEGVTNAATKSLLGAYHVIGSEKGALAKMSAFLYFTQPGGSSEAYLVGLKDRLPGYKKGEHGQFSTILKPKDFDQSFPATRSFATTKVGETSIYHYTIYRASQESSWQIQRAWKTTPDSKVETEIPLP